MIKVKYEEEYNPKVTIIIPVYNGANYMKEAIDSAISQSYKNIEIIVVNDGSTDETDEIAKSYGNKIRYFAKENGGVSTALNLGIKEMTGEYFSWLSHDDRYYPNKIQKQIEYLRKNNLFSKKVILYSDYDVINEKSEVTNQTFFEYYSPNSFPEYALLRGYVSGTALLIPRQAFIEHGFFDERYRCIQDYLLFYKFMEDYKYIFIPSVTNSTRVHSKQVTNVNKNIINENNYLWTMMQKELSDDAKIRLEGSLYKFYYNMYNFLINHDKYYEAHEYSKQEMEKYLNIELKKIKKITETLNVNNFIAIAIKVNKCIYLNKNVPSKYKEIYEVVKNIGIEKTIDNQIILPKVSDNKILEKYNQIKENDFIPKITILQKICKSIKENGKKATIKKCLKIIRRIVLYLPKRVIIFILNS